MAEAPLGDTDAGHQRLDHEVDFCVDMRMDSGKGSNDPPAYHATVFIVCIGQHDDILGTAAAGDGVAPAQVATQGFTQLLHDPVHASLGQRFLIGRY